MRKMDNPTYLDTVEVIGSIPVAPILPFTFQSFRFFNPDGPRFGGDALTTVITGARVDKNRKTQTVTLTLLPGGVVPGTIRNGDGMPILNVWVSAHDLQRRQARTGTRQTSTDG